MTHLSAFAGARVVKAVIYVTRDLEHMMRFDLFPSTMNLLVLPLSYSSSFSQHRNKDCP